MTTESEIIARYLADATAARDDVLLGIGDDCALLQPRPGKALAVSMDTLVLGRHFSAETEPVLIGRKSMAVNLSDLAAMGAEPAWVTLSLTMPEVDASWLAGFCQGFSELAAETGVQLVGGDLSSGPLSISVQAHGFVGAADALRRDGARVGDLVYVSGTLGDAGLALLARQGLYVQDGELPRLNQRLDAPTPRLALGRALAGLASSCIDLSDGLSTDLARICVASDVGARVRLDDLPLSPAVATYVRETGDWAVPLASGDDYELCFTLPEQRQGDAEALAEVTPVRCIGQVERGGTLVGVTSSGEAISPLPQGFDHFA